MTIPQRILLHVAVGAGLVIAVATAVTYGIVYNGAKERDLKHLETYVTERARREEMGFKQVEENLLLVRGQFLKRMEEPSPSDLQAKWSERFEMFPDGSWRSYRKFSDGRKYATLWAHKDAVLTPELQTEVLRAQDLCDELLPGWVDAFPSVYFVLPAGPAWLNIGYDPRIANWVWETPADYDATSLEWFRLALPDGSATNAFGWTGIIEEPTTKVPIVSVYLPIVKDGKILGSIGHDKYVNRMMEEITRSELPGARHLIFRSDGRIIAHPTKLKEILADKGQLRMQNSGEPELASLYQAINLRTERQFSGYDPGSGLYYCAGRLAGPDWFFVTTMPREQLQRQAFASAKWVLWSGIISLALMHGFLAATLRRQIARPLAELTRATKQMSSGDASARAVIKRDDELGTLANAFNEMAGRVASRDAELKAEKASLERHVADRTAELRESEARMSTVFRASPTAVSLGRLRDGKFVAVNEAFVRVTGYSADEILGHNSLELGLYAHLEHRENFFQQIKAAKFVQDYEYTLRTKQGQLRSMVLSAEMVEVDGEPHVLAVASDITSRKEAEERLRESEARFVTAFRHSPAMQSLIRADDRMMIEVNDTFLNKLGLVREQVVGKFAHEVNFWFDPKELEDFAQELSAKGFVLGREVRLRAGDGHVLTVLLSTQPLEIGGVPHFLSAGVDITARTDAEEKLRESEARFSTAFETSPLLMTIARLADGRFVEVNPAFMQHVGLERDAIIGRDSRELALWVDVEARADFFRRLKEDRVVRNVEAQIRTQRGSVHIMQLSGEVIEINREPHLITFGLDVTDQRRAEAELLRTLERERELNELKTNFVSLVSHEFRTPLEIILSSADNLDRYHDRLPPEKRQQLLQSINKSVRRMAGMMEEVLVLGRLETDRITFKPSALKLSSFCQRVCDEISSATGGRCPIRLQLDETSDDATGDESLLRHIFTNLLSNAVKYSTLGEQVAFTVQRAGENAVCRIADHGCGIPEADHKRLFEAFHRGSNVGQIPGTGLGLLIVERCVTLHGGKIEFQSAEGRGTTFTVTLPLFIEAKPEADVV